MTCTRGLATDDAAHILVSIFGASTALVLRAELLNFAFDGVLHKVLLVLTRDLHGVLSLHAHHLPVHAFGVSSASNVLLSASWEVGWTEHSHSSFVTHILLVVHLHLARMLLNTVVSS